MKNRHKTELNLFHQSPTPMPMDLSTLEFRYVSSCRRHKVPLNMAVLSWFSQAKIRKLCHEKCTMVVQLDDIQDVDIPPLYDVFLELKSSEVDAVDVLSESYCLLDEEYILSLLRAVNLKLRVVSLHDISLTKDFFSNLSQGGLACQVLKLKSSRIQKLNMEGRFVQLHTLNLDFCSSLTSLQKGCFSCMPNLMRLSMCETRVSNLWTTIAALSELPSLVELRFQNCTCCKNTGPCPSSFSGNKTSLLCESTDSVEQFQSTNKVSPDPNDVICPRHLEKVGLELSYSIHPIVDEQGYLQNESAKQVSYGELHTDSEDNDVVLNKFSSHYPSPICFEKHYREYMVASLPHLEVLDNACISNKDREIAKNVFSEYFEYLPYKRRCKESVISIFHNRETGTRRKSRYSYLRSLCAAKMGSSPWPHLHPVSSFSQISKEGNSLIHPRQFEYHPTDSSLMALGTLNGEVVVINHENGNAIGHTPPVGSMHSVMGLCWLKKYPSKLLAGSSNGSLKLYDINHMPKKVTDIYCSSHVSTFDDFKLLTSVHSNSTDDQFVASGYLKDVALYDLSTGRRLQLLTNLHREPINVAKFSNHSPFLFATCSFDRDVKMWDLRQKPVQPCFTSTTSCSRGNVMVCFSPDDLYLLVSAVDNEVKQFLAADGRLHTDFGIASTGSAHNYTRSYYMNGRDYIISGSCDEHVVRICSAQTGRRLRDVYLEDANLGNTMFVRSLRSDPFRDFHMSILAAASVRPNSKCEIVKINMLASSDDAQEYSYCQGVCPPHRLGC